MSGRMYGTPGSGNHRRTSSNVSNSSIGGVIGLANSSNVNPSFRLEDELDSIPTQTTHSGRVAFDLDPRSSISSTAAPPTSYRIARQNSLEMERPGSLVSSITHLNSILKAIKMNPTTHVQGPGTAAFEIESTQDQLLCRQQHSWQWGQ